MGANPSLHEETQEALRESFDLEIEGSTPNVSLVFNDRAVNELLANEPLAKELHKDQNWYSSNKVAASIAESRAALDAGVRPRGSQSVVEQLMMELSLATVTQSSHATILERRMLVLQALHAHISSTCVLQ